MRSAPELPERPASNPYRLHPKGCPDRSERMHRAKGMIETEAPQSLGGLLIRRSNLVFDPGAALAIAVAEEVHVESHVPRLHIFDVLMQRPRPGIDDHVSYKLTEPAPAALGPEAVTAKERIGSIHDQTAHGSLAVVVRFRSCRVRRWRRSGVPDGSEP